MITQEQWTALQTQVYWNESDMWFLSQALSQDRLAYHWYCQKHAIPLSQPEEGIKVAQDLLNASIPAPLYSKAFWIDPLFFDPHRQLDFSSSYAQWQSFLKKAWEQEKICLRPIVLNQDECHYLFSQERILAPDSFYAHFSDQFQNWPIETWIARGYHETLKKIIDNKTTIFDPAWMAQAMNQRSCSMLLSLIDLAKKQNIKIDYHSFLKQAVDMHSLILTRFWIDQGASVTLSMVRPAIYGGDSLVLKELLSHLTSSDLELVKDEIILNGDPSLLTEIRSSIRKSPS